MGNTGELWVFFYLAESPWFWSLWVLVKIVFFLILANYVLFWLANSMCICDSRCSVLGCLYAGVAEWYSWFLAMCVFRLSSVCEIRLSRDNGLMFSGRSVYWFWVFLVCSISTGCFVYVCQQCSLLMEILAEFLFGILAGRVVYWAVFWVLDVFIDIIMSMVTFWFGWFGKCSGCVQLLEA